MCNGLASDSKLTFISLLARLGFKFILISRNCEVLLVLN
jgi:hypothetical protein